MRVAENVSFPWVVAFASQRPVRCAGKTYVFLYEGRVAGSGKREFSLAPDLSLPKGQFAAQERLTSSSTRGVGLERVAENVSFLCPIASARPRAGFIDLQVVLHHRLQGKLGFGAAAGGLADGGEVLRAVHPEIHFRSEIRCGLDLS